VGHLRGKLRASGRAQPQPGSGEASTADVSTRAPLHSGEASTANVSMVAADG
jgi:hypothetical protein